LDEVAAAAAGAPDGEEDDEAPEGAAVEEAPAGVEDLLVVLAAEVPL